MNQRSPGYENPKFVRLGVVLSGLVVLRTKAQKGNTGADALDDKEYQGASLISLLQNAENFIRNNSKIRGA